MYDGCCVKWPGRAYVPMVAVPSSVALEEGTIWIIRLRKEDNSHICEGPQLIYWGSEWNQMVEEEQIWSMLELSVDIISPVYRHQGKKWETEGRLFNLIYIHVKSFINHLLGFFIWSKVSLAEAGLELLRLLFPFPKCWDDRYLPPCQPSKPFLRNPSTVSINPF